jgi:aryl-alcohol dehydrogenase-like predicted oxidoreductase
MNVRPLGRSGLHVSPIGLGSWALGAGRGGATGLGPQDDDESIAAIHRALDLGINWIDTAAGYGRGHSERVIARALRGVRERPYVFTKCGTLHEPDGRERHCLEPASIRREIDGSRERLEVDALDLVYVHWPLPAEDLEQGWSTLAELRQAGKVRHLGASNFSAAQLAAVDAIAPITAVQPPYSLIDRDAERDVLPYCEEHGIGALVYSTLKHGLLTGAMSPERIAALPASDWRRGHPDFTEPRLSRHLALVAIVERIAERHARSCAEVAIAWALRQPAVTGVIVGGRRPAQVDGLVGAAELQLDDADLAELNAYASAER